MLGFGEEGSSLGTEWEITALQHDVSRLWLSTGVGTEFLAQCSVCGGCTMAFWLGDTVVTLQMESCGEATLAEVGKCWNTTMGTVCSAFRMAQLSGGPKYNEIN